MCVCVCISCDLLAAAAASLIKQEGKREREVGREISVERVRER